MHPSTIHITMRFYRKRTPFLVRDYNKVFPLPYYFDNILYRNGTYTIADLAAGPVCRLGGKKSGSKIIIHASDVLAKEYNAITDAIGEPLLIPIEYQDIENLTYPDEMFDVVHCVNALDHTIDAKKALSEIKRICKKGGWIYLRHAPDQKKNIGGGHFWNISVSGLDNGTEFIPWDSGFKVSEDSGFIISTMTKV